MSGWHDGGSYGWNAGNVRWQVSSRKTSLANTIVWSYMFSSFCFSTNSRVCKASLFTHFKQLCDVYDRSDLRDVTTYDAAKQSAQDFQSTKETLFRIFRKSGFGRWVRKPQEEKGFVWRLYNSDKNCNKHHDVSNCESSYLQRSCFDILIFFSWVFY